MRKHACMLMSVLYSPCVHCRDRTSSFIQLLLLLTSIDQFWRQVPFLTQCDLPALHARTCRSHGQHACQHSVQHPRHRRTGALPRDPPKMRPFGFPLFVAFEAAAMGCSLELLSLQSLVKSQELKKKFEAFYTGTLTLIERMQEKRSFLKKKFYQYGGQSPSVRLSVNKFFFAYALHIGITCTSWYN